MISYPSTITCPPEISSNLLRHLKKVDLPLPEGPIIQSTSPSLTVVLILFNTSFSPNDFLKSLTITLSAITHPLF